MAPPCVNSSHFLEQTVGKFARIQVRVGRQKFFHAAGAEEFSFPVGRLGQSIGKEQEDIAGIQAHAPFLIGRIVKNADRESR